MQFEGTAARWLQSVQRKVSTATWEEFCGWLLTRFGRNQHQALLRQLYQIHQTTTVADYVDRFSELIDHLAAYEPGLETLHYTTRFLDGLIPSIRASIAIQCPQDLDTAYSLALLQEEMAEPVPHFQRRPQIPLLTLPPPPRRPLPLPAPPTASTPLQLTNKPAVEPAKPATADDKWAALRAYRRARGLCFTCGERWGKDHQCKGTVQMHVLQEVLDLFQSSDTDDDGASTSPTAELHLLAAEAVVCNPSTLTFQLTASVQGHQVQLLIDSGSTLS